MVLAEGIAVANFGPERIAHQSFSSNHCLTSAKTSSPTWVKP
jgi:hypothetical protein